MERILQRIEGAIQELDLGISPIRFRMDYLGVINKALREIGASQLKSLQDESGLLRAAIALEGAV